MTLNIQRRHALLTSAATGLAVILAGCATKPLPAPPPVALPVPVAPPPPVAAVVPPPVYLGEISGATTPQGYRRDAASHLYDKNRSRIFKGKMPPLLYAIGVLQIEVDGRGQVSSTSWMRAPNHAPEVVAEIERTVRLAAPYPAPVRMGRVTYTDTWLWHKSGLFQLDTLTEGQY